MTNRRTERPVAIVLGCNDVGSAVACALHASGWSVVLVDDADPPWHRRGMAFTNAWYIGNAELDGAGACFCASLKSIPSVLAHGMIAATTWSWRSVADALHAEVLVDAGRSRRRPAVLRGRIALTIGIGADFVAGDNVDVALDASAEVAGAAPPQMQARDAAALASRRNSYVVASTRYGRFMTVRRIGDSVRAGEKIGAVGNEIVAAPASGVLLGLAARGARIEPGDELVEVDPSGVSYRCHGVDVGPRKIAADVIAIIARRAASIEPGAPPPVIANRVVSTGTLADPTVPADVVATLAPPVAMAENAGSRPVIGP
jgi:xanthine dehydrogenase accessory factor